MRSPCSTPTSNHNRTFFRARAERSHVAVDQNARSQLIVSLFSKNRSCNFSEDFFQSSFTIIRGRFVTAGLAILPFSRPPHSFFLPMTMWVCTIPVASLSCCPVRLCYVHNQSDLFVRAHHRMRRAALKFYYFFPPRKAHICS